MKIAIFSDVHANLPALEVVLQAYALLQPDMYVCLGDVVGYGGFPEKCCNIVRPLVKHCIVGNHDAAVSGRMEYDFYYDAAKHALDHHKSLLSESNIAWLRNLPYTVMHEDICFSHGSPVAPEAFDYVFNNAQAIGLTDHYHTLAPVTFMGHSHLTKSYELWRDGQAVRVREVHGPVMKFDPNRKYVVTVGSVGQPRDNDARACYTLYDTVTRELSFYRIDYDLVTAAEAILAMHQLSPDFGKRLYLGI